MVFWYPIKRFIPSEHNYNTLVSWLHVSGFTKPSSDQYEPYGGTFSAYVKYGIP